MMDWVHVKRIAWKDLRRLGGLWIALFVLWAMCLGYALVSMSVFGYSSGTELPSFVDATIGILITATFYALGWGGITFAAEHEEKTYGLLRMMPVNAYSVFYGKLLWGVGSTILLILALMALCFGCTFVHPFPLQSGAGLDGFVGPWLVLVPFAMSIGMFWSLRMKRPLAAIGVAGVTLLVTVYVCHLAAFALSQLAGGNANSYSPAYANVTIVVTTVLLFLLNRRLAWAWLPNKQDVPITATVVAAPRPSMWSPGFRRLLWLQRKRQWLPALVMVILLACSWATLGAFNLHGPASVLLFIVPLAIGVVVFRAEHEEQRYRFLAQIGVGPGSYWFSRIVFPMCCVAIMSVLLLAMALIDGNKVPDFPPVWIGLYFSLGFMAIFSVAQYCSIAIRSTILAVATAAMSAFLTAGWLFLCLMIQAPIWLVYVPVILLPLLASYLRVSRWFRDTGSWREWVVPAMPIVLMIVGAPIATALFRLNEIPVVELPSKLAERSMFSSDELHGRQRYEDLFERAPDLAQRGRLLPGYMDASEIVDSGAWQTLNVPTEIVDELAAATSGTAVYPAAHAGSFPTVSSVLIANAVNAEASGDTTRALMLYKAALNLARHRNDGFSGVDGLNDAWEVESQVYRRLISWAMNEQTAVSNVDAAVQFLKDYRGSLTPWSDVMAGEYWLEELENRQPKKLGNQRNEARSPALVFAPWEAIREQRLKNVTIKDEFEATALLESGGLSWRDYAERWLPPVDESLAKIIKWHRTTAFGAEFEGVKTVHDFRFVRHEHVRRGTIYQLAAIAHHMRTGSYEKLDTSGLPTDVYSTMPAEKLKLVRYDKRRGDPITSWCIVRGDVRAFPGRSVQTYRGAAASYPEGDKRPFVLPDFEGWSDARYERQIELALEAELGYPLSGNVMTSRANPLEDEGGYTFPVDEEADAYGQFEEVDEATAEANPSQPARRTLSPSLIGGIMDRVEEQTRSTAFRDVLGKMLLIGEVETKREILLSLEDVESVLAFVDELRVLLDDDDVGVSSIASRKLQAVFTLLSDEEQAKVTERASISDDDMLPLGLPIRNAENGHYYEAVPNALKLERDSFGGLGLEGMSSGHIGWEAARQAAEMRTFRGMRGHLATITTKRENDFLLAAFVDDSPHMFEPAWLGGVEGDAGIWRWACGPETGSVIWDATTETSPQYVNWVTGRPGSPGADSLFPDGDSEGQANKTNGLKRYLLWNSASYLDRGDHDYGGYETPPGAWLPMLEDAPVESGQSVTRYIVEYAPQAEEVDEATDDSATGDSETDASEIVAADASESEPDVTLEERESIFDYEVDADGGPE